MKTISKSCKSKRMLFWYHYSCFFSFTCLRSDFAFSKMNASACTLVFASSWPFSGPCALLPRLLESLSTGGPCLSLCLPYSQNSHCCHGCISDIWLIMSPPLIQMEIIYTRVNLDWNMNSWEANIILHKWLMWHLSHNSIQKSFLVSHFSVEESSG